MNCETTCIKAIEEISAPSGQQNIEADIVLPDYYDSIGKIVRCELIPRVEAVNTTEDRVSVFGSARLHIVYCGEDNNLYQYENDYKYTKILQDRNAGKASEVRIKQNLFSVSCKASGPKRIDVRAVLLVSASLLQISDKNVICDIENDNIILKKSSLEIMNPVCITNKEISISKKFSSDEIGTYVRCVLSSTSRMTIDEIKPISNKIFIKGSLDSEINYFDKENRIGKCAIAMPFSEILDVPGVQETDICRINTEYICCEINLSSNVGEADWIEINASVCISTDVFRRQEISLVSDAYSLNGDLKCLPVSFDYIQNISPSAKTETFTFEADIFDDNNVEILSVTPECIKLSTDYREGQITYLITSDFSVIYRDSVGMLTSLRREFTKEAQMTCNASNAEIKNARVCVSSISALRVSSGKLHFNCDMLIETDYFEKCKMNCFTEIELIKSEIFRDCGYVVYFAQKDEDIWSIAKENRISADSIRTLNNLTGDTIEENKTLLLPVF